MVFRRGEGGSMSKPTAWLNTKDNYVTLDSPDQEYDNLEDWVPLYLEQPKRQPLSHDEITAIALKAHTTISPYWVFCRAVEKAHGIGVGGE